MAESDTLAPRERLRAFEDKLFPNHPRPHGEIERGIGSPFSGLDDKHRAHYAALQALITADAEHTVAAQAEAATAAALAAAEQRADDTEAALAPPAPEPAAAPEPPPAGPPPVEPLPAPTEPPPAAVAVQEPA